MSEREVQKEGTETITESDDSIDPIATTFLASRERHEGIDARLTDVSVTAALVPVSERRVVDDENVVRWSEEPDRRLTEDAVAEAITRPPQTIRSAVFDERTIMRGASDTFDQMDFKRIVRGDTDIEDKLLLQGNRYEDTRIAQMFGWRHVVTATVEDTGLGQEETLQWTFTDADEAEATADTLRQAANGDADATISYDDGLTLVVDPPEKTRTERIGLPDDIDWGDVAMGSWITLMSVTMFAGTSLGALFLVAGVALMATQFVEYEDQQTAESITADETTSLRFTRNDIIEAVGDDLFEHGGVTEPTSVTVTQHRDDNAIRFVAEDDDDDRVWSIPLSDTETIEAEDDLAFLNAVGAERLGEGEMVRLYAALNSTAETTTQPTLLDEHREYRLYPMYPEQ